MANPGMIGGGRLTRAEQSGDTRRFEAKKIAPGPLLKRMWKYLGRNRLLLVLAVFLSATSSLLSLYGPKLSGQAINAIDLGRAMWILTPYSHAPGLWPFAMCCPLC